MSDSPLTAVNDQMERDLPEMERFYSLRARLYWSFYEDLTTAGFDADAAVKLTICEFEEPAAPSD